MLNGSMNTLKITAVAKCLLPGRPSSRNTQHEKRYTFITQILQVCAFDSSSSSFRPTFYLLYVFELEPNRQPEKKEDMKESEKESFRFTVQRNQEMAINF